MRFKHGLLTAGVAVTLLAGTAGTAFAVGDPSPTHIAASSHVAATKAPTAAYKAISGPGQDGDFSAKPSVSPKAVVPGGLVAAGANTAAKARAFLEAHPNGVAPKAIPNGGGSANGGNSGYEYSSAFATPSGTETWGTVTRSVAEQGLQESTDHGWLDNNHSLTNFVVAGTCASGNSGCTVAPLVEIQMISGQTYCKSSFPQCFDAWLWKNGNWQNADSSTAWVAVNQPNNETYHPGGTSGNVTLGYQLDNTNARLDIVANGTILGYFPYSYWGQSVFGPITEESVQSEMFQSNGNFGTEPYASGNYTFSNFADSNGNTLGTPAVSSDYSVSGASGTGWTVSGGRAPSDTTTSWPIELDQDGRDCLSDSGGTTVNGNPIVSSDCSTWRSYQAWRYDPTTKEVWYQNGGSSAWCLDDPSNSTANNTALILEACSGLTGEKFNVSVIGNAYKLYKMSNGVVCINYPGSALGSAVKLYACNSTASQQNDTYDY